MGVNILYYTGSQTETKVGDGARVSNSKFPVLFLFLVEMILRMVTFLVKRIRTKMHHHLGGVIFGYFHRLNPSKTDLGEIIDIFWTINVLPRLQGLRGCVSV